MAIIELKKIRVGVKSMEEQNFTLLNENIESGVVLIIPNGTIFSGNEWINYNQILTTISTTDTEYVIPAGYTKFTIPDVVGVVSGLVGTAKNNVVANLPDVNVKLTVVDDRTQFMSDIIDLLEITDPELNESTYNEQAVLYNIEVDYIKERVSELNDSINTIKLDTDPAIDAITFLNTYGIVGETANSSVTSLNNDITTIRDIYGL